MMLKRPGERQKGRAKYAGILGDERFQKTVSRQGTFPARGRIDLGWFGHWFRAACCGAGLGEKQGVPDPSARILFVEDDAHVRLLIEDTLRDAGYAVESAGTVAGGQ